MTTPTPAQTPATEAECEIGLALCRSLGMVTVEPEDLELVASALRAAAQAERARIAAELRAEADQIDSYDPPSVTQTLEDFASRLSPAPEGE